jgi:hypothetical protein
MKKYLLTLLTAVSLSAHADFLTGNKLYTQLTGDATDQAIALGYVLGVSDATQNTWHCAPSGVSARQVRDVVQTTLEKLPQLRHHSASELVAVTLGGAWPCPQSKKNSL